MEMQMDKGQCQSVATTRLYDAALLGDVQLLLDLLKEDPLILERCIIELSGKFKQSPLHVAVNLGHLDFVIEILHQKPELAEMIDKLKRLSPLHIASAKGHLKIIEALIEAKPSMCIAHDQEGRTPIFVAAVNGQIDALELLHRANPYAAQGRTNYGETILHLCVKQKQLKALQRLLEVADDDGSQLINSKDDNGNTILHLAVIGKHSEMIEFLAIRCPGLNKNAINKNKMTIVDILKEQNRKYLKNWKVEQYLKRAKARPANEVLNYQADGTWLEEQRTSLMVVASLIATMAFTVGISPPGGVWQDTHIVNGKNQTEENYTHLAGTSVWSYKQNLYKYEQNEYSYLLVSNTIGLMSSLSVILLLISGFPCKRYFLFILRITLWISVTATTTTYYYTVDILTFDEDDVVWNSLQFCINAWLGLIGIMLFGHVVRFVLKLIGWERRQSLQKFCKRFFPRLTSTADNSSSSNNV